MDPNTPVPQGENTDINMPDKPVENPIVDQPVASEVPFIPEVKSPVETAQMPSNQPQPVINTEGPALSVDTVSAMAPPPPPQTKKSSPLLLVALILLLLGILALGGYMIWSKFSSKTSEYPIIVITPTAIPTEVPTEIPVSSPSATPSSEEATPSSSPSVTSTPSASPLN